MGAFRLLRAGLAEESQEHQACHVEGGEEGRCGAQDIEDLIGVEGIQQDLILAPEAGEGEDPRQGQGPEQEGPEGDGHLPAKPAHLHHILFLMRAMDDRT